MRKSPSVLEKSALQILQPLTSPNEDIPQLTLEAHSPIHTNGSEQLTTAVKGDVLDFSGVDSPTGGPPDIIPVVEPIIPVDSLCVTKLPVYNSGDAQLEPDTYPYKFLLSEHSSMFYKNYWAKENGVIKCHRPKRRVRFPGKTLFYKQPRQPAPSQLDLPKPGWVAEQIKILRKFKTLRCFLRLRNESRGDHPDPINPPRDSWHKWANVGDGDRSFKVFIIMLMSSSTTDDLLGKTVTALFTEGITSFKALVTFVEHFGFEALVGILYKAGRYYENSSRILNAAQHFVKHHGGIIPDDITLEQLMKLDGVGHKIACVILYEAFGRVEGIPCDTHMIKMFTIMGWALPSKDGHKVALDVESWMPRTHWGELNNLFAGLGQILNKTEWRHALIWQVRSLGHGSPIDLVDKFIQAYHKS